MLASSRPLLAILALVGCASAREAATEPEPQAPTPEESTSPPTGEPPDNVLLLTIDTLRGDSFPLLATLTRMEGEALVLESFWTHTWTYLGMGTILTGQHPGRWGPESHTANTDNLPFLAEDVPTLAEVFGTVGFATALASGSIIVSDTTGLDRGYATVLEPEHPGAEELSRAMVSWIGEQAGPWFAHVHVIEPHAPYSELAASCSADVAAAEAGGCRYDTAAEELLAEINADLQSGAFGPDAPDFEACRAQIEAQYACGVTALDEALATWLAEPLEALGVMEDTLVVVANDHGEGLLDPWVNHSGESRAPVTLGRAVIWRPGLVAPDVLSLPTGQDDLAPTMLGLMGVEAEMPTTGRPYWGAGQDRVVTTFWCGQEYTGVNGRVHAAIGQGQHLLYRTGGEHSLYEVATDPTEQFDVYGTVPVLDALWEAAIEQDLETGEYCGWLE